MAKKKLTDFEIKGITEALCSYFGQTLNMRLINRPRDEDFLYYFESDKMYSDRGIFGTVIANYSVEADVVRHKFDGEDHYLNGKVYRIHPHISWRHHGGGTNGHSCNDVLYVEFDDCLSKSYYIRKTLR